MTTLLQDLRYACRNLMKSPVFAVAAVLTMALGIGVNTGIFTVVNAVLLRPLPYPNQDRLVRVWGTNLNNGRTRAWTSYPNLQDLRAQNTTFEKLGAYNDDRKTITGHGQPEQVSVAVVTQDFFSALGIQPALGRLFLPQEFDSGHDTVLVLSYGFWQRRFGGAPGILGQTITLGDRPQTIVGVLPANDLQFPSRAVDVWAPMPPDTSRGSRNLSSIGLLKPGVSVAQAQSELSTISSRLERDYKEPNSGIGVRLEPLREALVADSRPLLLILLGVVGLVLLIASVNVANLLLARVATREGEIAIRIALGASRFRVIRQLLTESVLLTLVGGAFGLLLAAWTTHLLAAFTSLALPRQGEIRLDGSVLAFTLLLSILPGLLIGVVPALQASRPDLAQACKGSRGTAGATGQRWARQALVISEIALSVVLLTGAGLLIASFWRLGHVNPGFRVDNVLSFQLNLPNARYPNGQRIAAFDQNLIDRLGTMPGVLSVGAVSMLPLGGGNLCNEATLNGLRVASLDCVGARSISPDYFSAMGIPLIGGRALTARDNAAAPRVAVINRTMARLLGSADGAGAIGQKFGFRDEVRQVVGVVEDVHHSALDADAQPEAYLPFTQHPLPFMAFVVRTVADPTPLATVVRPQVWSIDKDLPVRDLKSLDRVVADSIAQPRFRTMALGGFAALALFLAVLGLYSVVAYIVSQRTQEIGLRVALGAQPRDVIRLVVGQGLTLASVGVIVGLAGAAAATRVLSAMLFGVTATEPLIFAAVAALMVTVTLAASYLPARKALRVDPIAALRYE